MFKPLELDDRGCDAFHPYGWLMLPIRPGRRPWRSVWAQTLLILLALTIFTFRAANAKEVILPLTIDYPLLTALVTQSFFPGPEHTALLVAEDQGCRQIILSDPLFREGSSNLVFEIKVFVRLGATVLGSCLAPVEWEGYLVMEQDPIIDDPWELSFITTTSSVIDNKRNPAKIANLIWEFANQPILDYLKKIRLDLAAPVADIRSFLLPLFSPEDAARANRFLESMRPGKPQAAASALRVPILAEIEEVERPERKRETIPPEEKKRLVEIWEAYDAFLVQAITALAQTSLTPSERDIFLDTLLQMRYRFVQDLELESPEGDSVRLEFVKAWNRLSPVFRSHLIEGSNRSLLGYLAFMAGSDALVALDVLGPSVSIEINRDGLIRLARYLVQQPVSLDYSYVLNQTLRDTLGLGPPPIASFGPEEAPGPDDLRVPSSDSDEERHWVRHQVFEAGRWGSLIRKGLACTAWAEEGTGEKRSEEIKSWLVPSKKALLPYVERVRGLLGSSSKQVLAKNPTYEIHPEFFQTLATATAWQESCFRQFVVKDGVITFLRSYNGTSVGIMQINERVWRGIYAENSLRWDIRYNAVAGSEILHLYLTRYALATMNIPPDGVGSQPDNLLEMAVYAMYNAGPGSLKGFLKRAQRDSPTRLEKSFNEKLEWVQNEEWENILLCY